MKPITPVPSSRVPVLDPNTGLMSSQWYRFFQNLYELTKDINDPVMTLPVYASNAAAIAGGLAVGQLYRSGTGAVYAVY